MARAFPRVAVWLAVLLLAGAGAAMADSTTLTFVDSNTVSGTFKYDVTTNTLVSWDFTSSAFGGTTFDSSTANGQCFGVPCGSVQNNQDGDVVFGFDAFQPNVNGGTSQELDIVIACGGAANCVQNILLPLVGNGVGNSFAITSGPATCPDPNSAATGLCVESGQNKDIFNCLTNCILALAGNNYITITDPPSPGDVIVDMTLSNVPVGTVLTGGGGNNNVPEPSTLLLSALGLGGLALKRFYS